MATLKQSVKKLFKRSGVKNPSALATQPAYRGNYVLSPSNAYEALGGPKITFPGATGTKSGPGIAQLQKQQIVYGQRTQGNFFDLGGGWTFGAFDRQPSGGIYNKNQV